MSKIDVMITRATSVGMLISMLSGLYLFGTNKFKTQLTQVVREETSEIKKEIKQFAKYVDRQRLININKQYAKIRTDVNDIKIPDIEQAIDDWQFLSEEYKTAKVELKIEIIKGFYRTYQGGLNDKINEEG